MPRGGTRTYLLPSPHPEHLQNFCHKSNRWTGEAVLVCVNNVSFPYQVYFREWNCFGLVEELPSKVEDWTNDDHRIVLEEGGNIADGPERAVADEGEHHTFEDESDPAAIRLKPAAVRECTAVDALSLTGVVEPKVGRAHDDVVDDTTSSDKSDQPRQDHLGTARDRKEREEWEADDHAEAEDGDATLRAFAQEGRCTAFKGHAIEGARGTVGVRITTPKGQSGPEEDGG